MTTTPRGLASPEGPRTHPLHHSPVEWVRSLGGLFGDHDLSWAFAAVWLVFLGYPVASLLTSQRSTPVVAYGLAVIVAFIGVYIAACVRIMPFGTGVDPRPRSAVAFSLALFALMLASIPALSQACLSFGPYLMALAVFGLGRRIGLPLIGVIVIGSFLAQILVPGWEIDTGTMLALIVVGVVMGVVSLLQSKERQRELAEGRRREADEQLAVVAERERVARDVHDILGHSLTVMTVKSELAGRLIDIDPERAKAELRELHAMSRHALGEVRATVGALRTPDLRTEIASARTALAAAAIDADLPVEVSGIPGGRGALFAWVLRESVTNIVRHSGAGRCVVEVDDHHIEVVDDGRGIADHAFGNGLRGLTERVEAAGGRLSVVGTAAGTAVRVTVA